MPGIYEITVGHAGADLTGNTNEVIQAAVDRVAALGRGTVRILPGTYVMNDSLHLRSGVNVQGSGSDTVLLKPPSVSSQVIHYLGYGHFDVSVAEPEKFQVGMGIRVKDDNSGGFYNTVATIIGKQGNELVISRMLNHDYDQRANARAVTVYPIISGYHLKDVCICDLTIDGNASENEYIDGCLGGGIFVLQARNTVVRNVTVRNYNGDGFSFQQTRNFLIENCLCEGNKGHGLHPGSGSVGPVIRNVVSRNNGVDGLFYCLRVSYSLCEGCTFEGNKGVGISIGHRDTDAIIRNNSIKNNGRNGVYFREDGLGKSGHRTVLEGNDFNGNCREQGKGEIYLGSYVEDLHIYHNKIKPGDETGGSNPAVYVKSALNRVYIYENDGLDSGNIELTDENFKKEISFEKPVEQLCVGPESARPESFYHLGI